MSLYNLFMSCTINIYSDESSHTNDGKGFMLLGAIWAAPDIAKQLAKQVKLVKLKHSIPTRREIKWTKVGLKKIDYYKDLIDLFVNNDSINYRAVIVDKSELDHSIFNQTHDEFYYKMQYYLVRNIASQKQGDFKIYLDYKDTWSTDRCKKLTSYLSNTGSLIGKNFSAQAVRSHEVTALQISDLLTGTVAYANKTPEDQSSQAKQQLTEYLQSRIGQKLTIETPFGVEKFNLFFWKSRL